MAMLDDSTRARCIAPPGGCRITSLLFAPGHMATCRPPLRETRLSIGRRGAESEGVDVGTLIAEGEAAPVEGWDFSWFSGRATEERPDWGYGRQLSDRLSRAEAALDVQTGGAEVYAEALGRAARRPGTVAATESWAPNLALARRRLQEWGGEVAESADDGPLPFPDATFDLVSSRHPTRRRWDEIARVL